MEAQRLDIIQLIEQNPITKLSQNYQGKFIKKIQETFNDTQQKLFLASFYTYLNYNSKTDFVIELQSIWKWLGFDRKEECKRVLSKHFIQDTDYKIFTKEINEEKAAQQLAGAGPNTKNLGGVGLNKEKILMTINTFKKLCLKSCTKKADEIHDYFIKLEEITQEIVTEESNELKLQLIDAAKVYNDYVSAAKGSPLVVAVSKGHLEIVKILVSAGCATVNEIDPQGQSVLSIAVEKGKIEIVEYFLLEGADPNTINEITGQTALHVAAERGKVPIAELLIKRGANPWLQDKQGRTPLLLAATFGRDEMRLYLKNLW